MTDSKTIILRGKEQEDYASKLLSSLPKDKDKPQWVVTFEKYYKQRSTAQNSLYWKWIDVIGQCKPDGIVMTRELWHYALAIMFLDPIEVPNMKTGEMILVPRSTRGLKTSEFSEYLNKIEEWAIGFGIILPHPDDLTWSL